MSGSAERSSRRRAPSGGYIGTELGDRIGTDSNDKIIYPDDIDYDKFGVTLNNEKESMNSSPEEMLSNNLYSYE